MRKLLFVCAGLVALAVTGLAVAHGIDGAKSVKSVAGTFTATTAAGSQTRTCTTTDGKTIVVSQGKYTGLAAGDPDLTGPIKVDASRAGRTPRRGVGGKDYVSEETFTHDAKICGGDERDRMQ